MTLNFYGNYYSLVFCTRALKLLTRQTEIYVLTKRKKNARKIKRRYKKLELTRLNEMDVQRP